MSCRSQPRSPWTSAARPAWGYLLTGSLVVLAALTAAPAVAAADACKPVPESDGLMICGDGPAKVTVFEDSTSPSGQYAIGWTTASPLDGEGLPDAEKVVNHVVRLADGKPVARLAGRFWRTPDRRPNRSGIQVVWSVDNRTVFVLHHSRWSTDTVAVARFGSGDSDIATGDLHTAIEPAARRELRKSVGAKATSYSFSLLEEPKLIFSANGELRFFVQFDIPKQDGSHTYKGRATLTTTGSKVGVANVSMKKAAPPQ